MVQLKNSVTIGPQGRLVLPVRIRKLLKAGPGTELVVRVEGESVILEKREQVLHRLQKRFSSLSGKTSLATELIQDRKKAVNQE